MYPWHMAAEAIRSELVEHPQSSVVTKILEILKNPGAWKFTLPTFIVGKHVSKTYHCWDCKTSL